MEIRFASLVCSTLCALALGCKSADEHRAEVSSGEGSTLTVGNVQKNIRVGMSGAEVAEALGSPNIVTTDDQRREVWIYDKMATEQAYSNSEGGLFLVLGATSGDAGASSKTQRTLTVIIKFDEGGKVRDYAYHASKF